MMFSKSAVAAFAVALFATSVTAQVGANSTIDASTVLLNTRVTWCISQRNVCGTLCGGETQDNLCTEDNLAYTCNCASNGTAPGLQYYLGTIPTFVCNQLFDVCNAKNAGVASAQAKCLSDQKANCGTLDSTKGDFSTTSSSAAPTTTTSAAGGADAAATPTEATSSTSTGAAATMMAAAGNYGSGLLVAGAAAAFGMMI